MNRDGKVTSADTLSLSRNLQGLDYKSNPAVLDVDKNNIVSYADIACMNAYLMLGGGYTNKVEGCNTSFSYGTSTEVSANIVPESTTYIKHTLKTGDKEYYSLGFDASSTSNEDIMPYGPIGEDTRYPETRDFKSGIVRLSNGGTGFIVGNHTITTAGHCVYAYESENWPAHWVSDLKVSMVDSKGKVDASKTFEVVEAHLPEAYYNEASYNGKAIKNDYALITVTEDLNGKI